jgi:hypothetical protein
MDQYRVHKSPPLDHMIHLNPVYILISYFFKIRVNIIVPPKRPLTLRFMD